jgi:carbamate kinase
MVALGGNALLERHEPPDAGIQRHHIQRAAVSLAGIAADHDVVICFGNGPQVGLLAAESEADPALVEAYPLDALGAQTQGMIGYWLSQELRNAGVRRPVVAVVTQTVVDAADPAFATPRKFIGAVHTHAEAQQLVDQHGWAIAADGDAWRRVVASPQPQRIVEATSIRQLVESGAVVICGGGGGAPVVEDAAGQLSGVQAVVDKDLTAARIALDLHADRLLLLTDVAAVMRDFGTPDAHPINRLTVEQATGLELPVGSMGPKVAACAGFTSASGNPSAIGALTEAAAALAGTAGTMITKA